MSDLIGTANHIAQNLQGLPWGDIGSYVGASGILSVVLIKPYKWIKKYFDHHKEVMTIVIGVGGILLAAAHYLLTTPTQEPNIIVMQGLVISFLSQPFYKIILKPLTGFLVAKIVEAETIKAQAQTAIVPASGLPLPSIPSTDSAPAFDR
jgi:hypothetical protein